MSTKLPISDDAKNPPATKIDDTDKKILQALQDEFPLVDQPWTELSRKLSISENRLINRIEHLVPARFYKKSDQ